MRRERDVESRREKREERRERRENCTDPIGTVILNPVWAEAVRRYNIARVLRGPSCTPTPSGRHPVSGLRAGRSGRNGLQAQVGVW